MSADRRILEDNLERLLRRAYAPTRPRPQFRSRLERAIEAHVLSPARTVVLQPRSRITRRLGAWAAAAAAVIAIAVVLRPRREEGLDALLARGAVATREEPEGRWRAAPAGALALRGFLELATPAGTAARVDVPARGTILVHPGSRAAFSDLGGEGLLARLATGRLVLDRSAGPPWSVETAGRRVRVEEPHAEVPSLAASPAVESGPPAPPPGPQTPPPAPGPARPHVLRGQVVDAAFRRPVGRFTVAVLWNGERHGSIQPVTREFQDAEGRFELDAIPTGPHSVFVRAEGFATWRTSVTLPAEVAPVLAQGADVRGLVRDHATGDPVEGALVISETDAPVASLAPEAAAVPPGTRGALTGPDGTFSLESLSTGTQVLRASAPGRAPAWARLTLAPGERREVALRLPRGGGIRGRVTLSDQTPMADVNIVAYWGETAYPNGPCTIATTKTEADGRYILTHLPEGAWSVLCFDQESKSPSAPSIRMVEVRGSGFTTVDFMGEPGTTLHGVVRNGAGEPIAKFAFSLTKRDGSHGDTMRMGGSREDGSYEVRDVAPGLYDVFNVRMLGTGLTWIGEVEIGAGPRQEQNFTVGALRIAGRVSDGTTGEPLPDAVVIIEVLQVPQGAGRFAAKALIASDGSYEAVGLPAGIYRVIAYSGAGRLGYEVLDPVVLGDGAGVAEANLRLFPGGTVAVQVVSADGWPVKGALVTLIDRAGNPITFATEQKTDAQGLYEARGLRPGLWRVAAARPGGPRVENRVVVRPEATHRLVLTLP